METCLFFFTLWTPRINHSLLLCNNNPFSYKDCALSVLQTKQCSYLQSFFVGHVPCASARFLLHALWFMTKAELFFSFQSYKQHSCLYISALVPLSAALRQLIYAQIRNCQRHTEEPWSKLSVIVMGNLWFSQCVQFSSKLCSYSITFFCFVPCVISVIVRSSEPMLKLERESELYSLKPIFCFSRLHCSKVICS